MPRFVAFLRGVSPLNASMPEVRAAFETAGFGKVRTLLSSGNVAFDSEDADERALEQKAEVAMAAALGRSFYTIVRPAHRLVDILAMDAFAAHGIPPGAKRVVSFFRELPQPRVPLPLAQDFASVFLLVGREAFTAYVPTEKGPVFMQLIQRAFGADVTTRTLDTVAKCAVA